MNELEPLLDLRGVGKALHLGSTSVYAMIASGQLPHVRLGRSIRVAPQAVREFIASRETAGLAQDDVIPLRARRRG